MKCYMGLEPTPVKSNRSDDMYIWIELTKVLPLLNREQTFLNILTRSQIFSLLAPLETPTVNGYRAIYARLLDYDPKNLFFPQALKTVMMIIDLWQYEEGTWPGFVIVIDMEKSVIGHLTRIDVTTIRQVLYFLQVCMD